MGREAAGAGPAPFQRQGQCIMQTGGLSSSFSPQFRPWPGHATLTSLPLSLFRLPPPFFFFPPPSPIPLTVPPRRRKLHIAVLTGFYFREFGWELTRALCDWKKAFGACPHNHLGLPTLSSRLLSSSWVHVVIKEDCWCVINLLKSKNKAKQETWFQLKPILILFYYFPLVRNKTLSNIF